MFSITMGKGFQMTFPNGVVASVQWGTQNYCEARDYSVDAFYAPVTAATKTGKWNSETAEVAAWIAKGADFMRKDKWITKELYPEQEMSDDVKGFLDTAEVLDFLNRCANYKP